MEAAVDELARELDPRGRPWGANLIHSPERARRSKTPSPISSSAAACAASKPRPSWALTPAIVRYAATGLTVDGSRRPSQRRHRVLAKVSREEVAKHFAGADAGRDPRRARRAATRSPAPKPTSPRACRSPKTSPAKADSGGHTDNRPLAACVLPTILALRDRIAAGAVRYARPIRVGAAGALGTPGALASAFALGAAYVQTGSVNQACVESGLGAGARAMLAQASMADVIMAPAADMFEMGV
ncbi:hypothetical protein PEC18_05480 [Paucibacter sp. O1-1]|nr:hypothetical protein [Paucibacter sp. O1-1]MDA3825321.1 hypothetical protein [Paucibacter sp. O1-1]